MHERKYDGRSFLSMQHVGFSTSALRFGTAGFLGNSLSNSSFRLRLATFPISDQSASRHDHDPSAVSV